MSIQAIRQTIATAEQHERETGHLAQLLTHRYRQGMHFAIQLPAHQPITHLLSFAVAYIQHVPDFLEAAHDITQKAHIERISQPFLSLAEDFFLRPPELLANHMGLDVLLAEAYLAHRLLEEVNDRYVAISGIPLIPLDSTLSNLIAHNLIGEPFANELDEAVSFAITQVSKKIAPEESSHWKAYQDSHAGNQWQQELRSWPCLTDTLTVKLQLPGIHHA